MAFENADLIQRIRKLFDEFIHAAVAAVEQRDPTTSGHSERVAILTVGLVEKVDGATTGPFAGTRFSRDEMEELRYAALLHDFGKVAVQEKYLRKGKKLYATQTIAIRQRFAYILKSIEADHLRARLEALESGSPRGGPPRGDRRGVRAPARRGGARAPGGTERERADGGGGGDAFRAVMNLPTRAAFANHEAEEHFPVEAWAEGPFLSRGRSRGAVDPQGQPVRRRSAARSRATSRTPTSSCRRSRGRASSGASPRSPGPTTRSSTARAIRDG